MKLTAIVFIAAGLLACHAETPKRSAATERTPVETLYVRGDSADVHAKASEASPVVMKYGSGESVSVFSKKSGWAEVRTLDGSGWTKLDDLATNKELKEALGPDNTNPRFKVPPAPVTQTTAHGQILLEASVNTDGDVIAVRTIANTTGSAALEHSNSVELQRAKFYAIVQRGKRVPFVYDYSVRY